MLPAFVIGLREGLETVVIIGAIALFLIHQGRRDQLRVVWIASAAAAVLCLIAAIAIRIIAINLSAAAQEQFEAIVGFVAVATVTYMVVWMRRFPKDLMRDSTSGAAKVLAQGSPRALAAMAFFAVLREGFEISVFVLALINARGSLPVLGTTGAALGILVAFAVGVGVVRGSVHLDVARFFRATAIILVLTAAGLLMTAVYYANTSGWFLIAQTPQFNWSWIAPPGKVLSSITTGMFGIQPYPTLLLVVVWLVYLVPMMLVVLWPKGHPAAPAAPAATQAADAG